MAKHEYAFDVKMFAVVRVEAETKTAAEGLVQEALRCASVNAGAWPNGDPILFEASLDGEIELLEKDGEAV